MKYTIHVLISLLFCLIYLTPLHAQKQYWDSNFLGDFKRRAVFFSLDEKDEKTIIRYFYQISDSLLVRRDLLDRDKRLIQSTYFFPNGKVKTQITIQANGKERLVQHFRLDGSLERESTSEANAFQASPHAKGSSRTSSTPSSNIPEAPTSYPDGTFYQRPDMNYTGKLTYFYDTGEKKFDLSYAQGKRTGPVYVWYRNGQLKFKIDGGLEPSKEWHANGQLAVHRDSLLSDGTHQYFIWDSLGTLRETFSFDPDGKMDGPHTYFYPNGNTLVSGNNERGQRNGNWEVYDQAGTTIETIDFSTKKERKANRGPSFFDEFLHPSLSEIKHVGSPAIRDYIKVDAEPLPSNIDQVKKWVGYPQQARDEGIQGQVVYRILLNSEGHPLYYLCMNSIHPVLDMAVERHIMSLRFTPAYLGAQKVSYWVNIPFNFKLLNSVPADRAWNFSRKKKKKKRQN